MSELQAPQKQTSDDWLNAGLQNVKLIYILYLAGLLIPISSLVGVVFAYLNRRQAPVWLQSHYTYQIRTFWLMLLLALIGAVLTFVIIGIFILIAAVIWYIVRCVKGLQALARSEPSPAP